MTILLSQTAAVDNLKRFVGTNTDVKRVTIDDIFKNTGRIGKPHSTNMSWLYNKMSSMRKFELFEPEYTTKSGKRRILAIRLTEKGREAISGSLGASYTQTSIISPSIPDSPSKTGDGSSAHIVTLQSLSDLVDEFNRQNPSWMFELVPKRLKKEVNAR